MNEEFKKAEALIEEAIRELKRVLGQDGEDVSCFTPQYLDAAIKNLVSARSHMAVGWRLDTDKI